MNFPIPQKRVTVRIGAKENWGRGGNAELAYLHEERERLLAICVRSVRARAHHPADSSNGDLPTPFRAILWAAAAGTNTLAAEI
jgi:hypothetical protein